MKKRDIYEEAADRVAKGYKVEIVQLNIYDYEEIIRDSKCGRECDRIEAGQHKEAGQEV
jgi:hypothetical protein